MSSNAVQSGFAGCLGVFLAILAILGYLIFGSVVIAICGGIAGAPGIAVAVLFLIVFGVLAVLLATRSHRG